MISICRKCRLAEIEDKQGGAEPEDTDEDAPASEALIAILGFDPDEDEDDDIEADALQTIADALDRLGRSKKT